MKKPLDISLTWILVLVVSTGLASVGPAFGQQTSIEAQLQFQLDRGKNAIAAGEFDMATEILEAAVFDAAGTSMEPQLLFSLGIAHQKNAEIAQDFGLEASEEHSVEGSVRAYERLVRIRPTSSPAYNNLGLLYRSVEQYERAARYLEMALEVESDRDRRALYKMNLGTVFSQKGDARQAAGYFRQALDLQPGNDVARDSMVAAYARTDSRELATYVWDLIEDARNTDAARTAIQVLAEHDLDERLSTELLSAMVQAMSRIPYKRGNFQESAGARELYRLLEATGSRYAEPVEAIFLLHEGIDESFDPSSYTWWGSRGHERRDPGQGVWPRDAYRALIRSLAKWHNRHGNPEVGERYLHLSIRLWEGEPDLDAIVNLCDVYVRGNDWGRIEQLLGAYSPQLFEAKGQAYRDSRWKEIFEYHRALGTMYGAIGRWGSSGDVTSAIFQLERAEMAAQEYNALSEVRDDPKKSVSVSPQMVNMLATAYDATSGTLKSASYRIDKTESYLTKGDTLKAKAVFTPVTKTGLPTDASASLKSRYTVLSSASRLSAVQLQPQIDASKLQRVDTTTKEEDVDETRKEAEAAEKNLVVPPKNVPSKNVLPPGRRMKLKEAKPKE